MTFNDFVGNCAYESDLPQVVKGLGDTYVRGRINKQDVNGETPLTVACRAGSKKTVSLLLQSGASPAVTNRAGQSPYDVALSDAIKSLLDEHLVEARLDIQLRI